MVVTFSISTVQCCLKEGGITSRTTTLVEISPLTFKKTTFTSIMYPKLVVSVPVQTIGWVSTVSCFSYMSLVVPFVRDTRVRNSLSWIGCFIPTTSYIEGSRVIVLPLVASKTRYLILSFPVCEIVAQTVIT